MILTHKSDLYTLRSLQGRFLSNGNGAAIRVGDDQGTPGGMIIRETKSSNGGNELECES
jgi:hypothetical protein